MAGRMRDSTEMIGKMSGKIDNLNSEMLNIRKQMEAAEKVSRERIVAPVQHKSIAEKKNSRENIPDSLHVEVAVAAIEAKVAQGMLSEIPDKVQVPPVVVTRKSIEALEDEEKARAARQQAAAAPVPAPAPVQKPPPPVQPVAVPEVAVKVPVKTVDIRSEQKDYDDDCVQITFPFKFNRDLIPSGSARLDMYGEKVESAKVRVLRGITCDDLVFELRHYIATEVCMLGQKHDMFALIVYFLCYWHASLLLYLTFIYLLILIFLFILISTCILLYIYIFMSTFRRPSLLTECHCCSEDRYAPHTHTHTHTRSTQY